MNGLQVLIAKGRKEKRRGALEGNYGPVSREMFSECVVVEGELPAELDGMYMRNGSNPFFDPVASTHWFEGARHERWNACMCCAPPCAALTHLSFTH